MSNLNVVKNRINNINFILCDINKSICYEWNNRFKNYSNVKIYNGYFNNCISELENSKENKSIAIVSPANSYGLMDGGYDKAIIDYFGKELQDSVQNEIMNRYCGEQPIMSSLSINIPNHNKCVLIHTPTMRTPELIVDVTTIYHCTRSSIIESICSLCDTIILPAFGGLTGGRSPYTVAYYMERALSQLINIPDNITWEYAIKSHPLAIINDSFK